VRTLQYTALLQRLEYLQIGTSTNAAQFAKWGYAYDNVGNIKRIDDYSANKVQTFTYDERDRLTDAEWISNNGGGAQSETYTYDRIGNLTNKGGDTYVYPPARAARPHTPTSVNGQPYTYDAAGNLMSGGGRTYFWDRENRLINVKTIADNTTEVYDYDGDGERAIRFQSGMTTVYIEGLWERDVGESDERAFYTFNGATIAQREVGGETRLLHGDHLGSVRLLTVAGGSGPSIAGQQGFRPWGSPDPGLPEPVATTRNYTGQYRDDTGLLYYHARFYDPVLGRFISPDTVVPDPTDPQDLNRYTYAKNNPLRYNDPTGHSGEDVQEFLYGIGAQWSYNNSWFAPGQAREALAAQPGESLPRTVGRHVGNVATAVQGVAEVVGGGGAATGGGAVCLTGVGCLAGAPVAAGGAAVAAHGATTMSVALAEEGKLIWQAITGGEGASGASGGSAAFSQKQLDKKFKHASDFGIHTTKKNPTTLAQFEDALRSHLADEATVQYGTYGYVDHSSAFFNPNTNNIVVLDANRNFVTGFKLDPGTKQFENYITNGMLR
jgi:RHS repeat-associated protein